MNKKNSDTANSVQVSFLGLNYKNSINLFTNCDFLSFVEDKHRSFFLRVFFDAHTPTFTAPSASKTMKPTLEIYRAKWCILALRHKCFDLIGPYRGFER